MTAQDPQGPNERLAKLLRDAKRNRLEDAYLKWKADPGRNEGQLYSELLRFAKAEFNKVEHEFPGIEAVNTADDYAQEVVIAVFKGLESDVHRGESFNAWVRKICYNQRADFMAELIKQKQQKVSLIVSPLDEFGGKGDPEDEDENPLLHRYDDRETRYHIPNSIQGVDRDICKMIVDGMNYAQAADILDITESAVKKRLERMRVRMKAERLARNERIAAKDALHRTANRRQNTVRQPMAAD